MMLCSYQYNFCFIKIILHSRHGVALFWVFKLLHVHLQLTVETIHLKNSYNRETFQLVFRISEQWSREKI